MRTTVALFTLLSLIAADLASADQMGQLGNKKVLLASFRETKTEKSACLVRPSNPQATLERYDVKLVRWSGNDHVIPIVGTIIREAERLYGKTFPPFQHIAIDMDPSYRILGQQVYDSQLRRAKVIVSEDNNLALVAHEMGHIIGNTGKPGGGIWYQAYNAAVPTPCHHTWYSNSGWDQRRRNEEFAEVFASYLTHPNLLKDGSASCKQAYDFMRKRIFMNADPACLAKPAIPLPRPRPADAPAATPTSPTVMTPATPAAPTTPVVAPVIPKPAEPAKPAPAKPAEPVATIPLPQPKPVIVAPTTPKVEAPKTTTPPSTPVAQKTETPKPTPAAPTKPNEIKPVPKPQPKPPVVVIPDRTVPQ